MAHIHSVYDANERFLIDPVSRAITNSLAKKIVVMQYDHNSERFTFEIPKVDGHNMAGCDRVEIHYINIDAVDKTKKSTGVYEVDDIKATEDGDKAVFSWLLSRNCTKYSGTLSFLIHFACTTEGVEDYAWNSAVFEGITIGGGMNNGVEAVEPYSDIIAQWKADLFGVGDTQEQRLLEVSAEQQAAIAAKGQAVLDSIPDEYEALQAQADENTRIKAGAIVLDAEGDSIVVNDASAFPLMGLKLFGKSTQDGTPTPDAPVDIVSVENPVVTVCGKNLIPFPYTEMSKTKNGVTFTVNNDGSIHIKGTAEKATNLSVFSGSLPLSGTFTLSGVTNDRTPSTHYMQPYVDDVFQSSLTNGSQTYEINGNLTAITLYVKSGETIDCVVRPQLENGSVATEYEAPTVFQTVETTHTLPGIPVASGGNYTDANGQQWICDEVDLARGVYVQRTNRYTVNVGDIETWKISSLQSVEGATRFDMYIIGLRAGQQACLCSHYPGTEKANKYPETCWCNSTGNASYFEFRIATAQATTVDEIKALVQAHPVDVVYALYTPIETPLFDAEINAFKALHSNKPNTTILNDAGAHMAVEYVADTKTYIDNKIKELMEGVTA